MSAVVGTVVLGVTDMQAARRLYLALTGAAAPDVSRGDWLAFSAGGLEIGLVPAGDPAGLAGPAVYWHTPDVLGRLAALLDRGWTLDTPVRKLPDGRMVCTLKDASGNVVGLLQPA
jgi:uncharacterized protein